MICGTNPVTFQKSRTQNQLSNAGSENQVYLQGEEKGAKPEPPALCSEASVLWAVSLLRKKQKCDQVNLRCINNWHCLVEHNTSRTEQTYRNEKRTYTLRILHLSLPTLKLHIYQHKDTTFGGLLKTET